jgi:hypothetical protein
MICASPVPGCSFIQFIIERPDAEIGIMGDKGISRHPGYLCTSVKAKKYEQQARDKLIHMVI